MRNLKKVLSLSLAFVMLLGMMVMGSAATKDFGDGAEITNVEAVDVMVALGVLEGDDYGNFNPADTLTREQAAKIICYMLMGPANAEKLSKNSNIFKDVAAGRWSAGYIAYCYNLGIIAGNGDGTFGPTDKLTAVAFGKMLLTALGYDADIEGYVNNKAWDTNIATDMIAAGIDIRGVALDDALSRDNAAQMAFNTLTAATVYYSEKIQVENGDNVTTISGGRHEVENSVVASKTYNNDADKITQFCEEYFPNLKLINGTFDAMARPAHEWTVKNVSVGVYTDEADYTAFIGGALYDLGALVDSFSIRFKDNTAPVFVNGAPVGVGTYTAKIGDQVELYMDRDDANKVARVAVTRWTAAKLPADVKTSVSGTQTMVQVPGVIPAFSTLNTTENVFGFEGLKKDDVVLYYVDNMGNYFFTKAESFSGIMTAGNGATTAAGTVITSGQELTISGAKYAVSEQTSTLNNATIDPETFYKTESTWYTDMAGNIVWVTGVPNAQWAYVVDATIDGTDIWGREVFYAKLLLNDGTIKTVQTEYNYSGVADTDSDDANDVNLKQKIVDYTVKGDVYTLADASDPAVAVDDDLLITNGNPVITLDGSTAANTNANTIFFVRDYKNGVALDKFTAYTGYAAVPTMDQSKVGANTDATSDAIVATYTLNFDGYVKYVVVDPGCNITGSVAATDLFYVIGDTAFPFTPVVTRHYDVEDGVYYWTVPVIKNGDSGVSNLEFAFDPSIANVATNVNVAIDSYKSYVVSNYDMNGRVASYGLAVTEGADTGRFHVGTGVATLNATTVQLAGTAYACNDDTVVYYYNGYFASVIDVSDIATDSSDTYVAMMADNTGIGQYVVKTLFIKKVDATAPIVTTHLANATTTVGTPATVTIAHAPVGGHTVTYAWYINGVLDPAATTTSYTIPDVAGTYNVKVVISSSNDANDNEVATVTEYCTVTVNPAP